MTITDVKNLIRIVRQEWQRNKNTALRVGQAMDSIADFFHTDKLSVTAQKLTNEQKAQARENIGVPNEVDTAILVTVDNYADLLLITPNTVKTEVFVISDEQNNNGNSSEYAIYPNGIIMWRASININQQ